MKTKFSPQTNSSASPGLLSDWSGMSAGARRLAERGATLVELLVVTGLVGTLGGIGLSAVSKAKGSSKQTVAKNDIKGLSDAIESYRETYGRLPASREANTPTFCGGSPLPLRDFTFGTVVTGGRGTLKDSQGNSLPAVISQTTGLLALDYQANNSEIVSILMDLEYDRTSGTAPTVNFGHRYNPKNIQFLKAKQSSGVSSPGVGDDLVYRDPWSNPYVVTLDLDHDQHAWDSFYSFAHVSEKNAPDEDSQNGLVRLKRPNDAPYSAPATAHPSDRHNFVTRDEVMVWSFGPDGTVDFNTKNLPEGKANAGKNKDNILSW
ncbi:MAG: hypothetical protein HZA92_15790 [Verrucomicrobia bacterium]|nr:hypothetical protein [Verrucomicrobiota bacterium]